MKNIKLIIFLCLCLSFVGAKAQDTHWSVYIYDYQYDMTAYVTLTQNDKAVDISQYEIGTFCGDECRGVATVQTASEKSYGYLRIRSNFSSGETITFKVYSKSSGTVMDVKDVTVDFTSTGVVGMPSNPLVLNLTFIPGDADGDNLITINDVIMTINASLNKPGTNFNEAAADVDGDGKITINDVIKIINMTLNNN